MIPTAAFQPEPVLEHTPGQLLMKPGRGVVQGCGDELVVTEGSLRIVRPDEIDSLTNSLTPIAKMLLKAALERDRELALSWKTTRHTGL